MVFKKIIVILFFSMSAIAQDKVEVKGSTEADTATSGSTDTTVGERTSKQLRLLKPVGVGMSWDLLSMWIPSKFGFDVSYNYTERSTIGFEYQSGTIKFPSFGIDLGGIKESKYGIVLKSFGDSNTFYASYGLMKYNFRASLETSLFPITIPIASLFDIDSIGFQFGLGNQWTWENGVSFGIDWFSIFYHAFNKTRNTAVFDYLSPSNRDKADKMVDLIYNVPIFELLKINLTYSF